MKIIKQHNMTILITTALTIFMAGCEINNVDNQTPKDTNTLEKSELQKLYETSFNGKTIFVNGDTTINQKNLQLHTNTQTANIDAIKNTNGTFRMVAIGGGISAGARDGGLYRNGQLTAFPNLIAQQMGIEFKQPLFAENEANGFGYRILTSISNNVPKYKAVSNNIALLKTSPVIQLNPYESNTKIDNWSLPFAGFYDWGVDRALFSQPYIDMSNPYKTRLFNNNFPNPNTLYQIINSNSDLIIMESGFDSFLNAMLQGGAFSSSTANNLSTPNYTKVLGYATSANVKAVMATIPDVTDFPITKYILADDVRKLNQSELFVRSTSDANSAVISIESGSFFLPSPLADSLKNTKIPVNQKRGFSYQNPLSYYEVYTLKKIKSHQNILNEENNYILGIKKYPIVDLYSLFKKVNSDNYVTNDNIKANNQNFFSSDGIFPSAFGQAIIANEYIKKINEFYKTTIPLIQTAYYLNK